MIVRVPHLMRAVGRFVLFALATYALHSRTSPVRAVNAAAEEGAPQA